MPCEKFKLKTTRGVAPHVRAMLLVWEIGTITNREEKLRDGLMEQIFGSFEAVEAVIKQAHAAQHEARKLMENVTGQSTQSGWIWCPHVHFSRAGYVEYSGNHIRGRKTVLVYGSPPDEGDVLPFKPKPEDEHLVEQVRRSAQRSERLYDLRRKLVRFIEDQLTAVMDVYEVAPGAFITWNGDVTQVRVTHLGEKQCLPKS